jgi:hypothetical protein
MEQESLFGARRRRGKAVAAVDRTLAAWRASGLLAGDEHAALRSTLRDLAEATDSARAALRAGEGTAYSYARCADMMRQAIVAASDGGTPTDDLDAALSALLRDAPQL